MTLAVAYYNSRLALWEPLIEPMESTKNGKRVSSPWELKTKVNHDHSTPENVETSILIPIPDSIQRSVDRITDSQCCESEFGKRARPSAAIGKDVYRYFVNGEFIDTFSKLF